MSGTQEPAEQNPLAKYVEQWRPAPSEVTSEIDESTARFIADILDVTSPAGGGLAPLSHWAYFAQWPSLPGLNADGHPAEDPFQPPIPGRRRMWAGGSVRTRRPLAIGQQATRRGEVVSAVPKSGRTGHMILATVRYEYHQGGELCIVEDQNHVYRGGTDDSTRADWGRRPTRRPASDAPWQHEIRTDPIRLFRMSAVTANSHRIHYDRPYAQDVEHYPDLVVHGPLLAMQLGVLAQRYDAALSPRQFDYRVQAPVFVGEPVLAVGGPATSEGEPAELQVVSEHGTVHVAARATYGG